MKNVTKQTTKKILLSMLIVGGAAIAAPGDPVLEGDDATLKNVILDSGRLYQHDGYGAQWALDTGSDGLWFVPKEPVAGTYSAPLKVRNTAQSNTLVIGTNDENNITNGYIGIGTDAPTAKLDVQWSDSDTANNHNLLAISANNAGSGASDVGFSMENKETDFKWTFRTYAPTEGFAASKIGTGGTEFQVDNTGTDLTTTVVQMGGVTVFESGHLVTASSRSLKTDIKPLDREAALDAFHKLQPVSYAYKAHKDEPVVGFIAEDVPELVAMPSRKSIDSTEIVAVLTSVVKEQEKTLTETRVELKKAQEKITKLELMQKRLVRVESLLTNLALDTSKIKKEKVSLQIK